MLWHRTIKKRQLGVELQTPIAERQGVCFRPHLPQGLFLGPLLFKQDHHYLDSNKRDSGEFQTPESGLFLRARGHLWGWAQKCCQTLGIKVGFTCWFVSCFLGKVWICQNKTLLLFTYIYIRTDFIGFNSFVVTYPQRHHHTLEDAASTSHTSRSPLSVCLCRRCPRYTERTPEYGSLNTWFIHLSDLTENLKKTEEKILTCLVFAAPKFLMYMSYSFTGGRSKMENVMEKSRSIRRSSSSLRFLESQ